MMIDDRQRLIRKFAALPEEKQHALCNRIRELLEGLKADWEAKPENAGKTVTYTELWGIYQRQSQCRRGRNTDS